MFWVINLIAAENGVISRESFLQSRSRGFPRSGVGPPFTAGAGFKSAADPRLRGVLDAAA
jgi:hypothetical protein